MATQTIDEAKLGAFMERVLGDAAGLMASILATLGDRLDLFKTLADRPATSAELAAAADVNERYAREWLRGMHAAGYVELARDSFAAQLGGNRPATAGRRASRGRVRNHLTTKGRTDARIDLEVHRRPRRAHARL